MSEIHGLALLFEENTEIPLESGLELDTAATQSGAIGFEVPIPK